MTEKNFKQIRDFVGENYRGIIASYEIEENDLEGLKLLQLLYISIERINCNRNVGKFIISYIKNNFFRENKLEEDSLMLYLFLQSLETDERQFFQTSFSEIEEKKQQGEQYLKDISESSLAEPQIYKGWGFRFEKPELFTEGEKHFIEINVAEVFEGSKLKDLGVDVGNKIRVEISKEQAKNIDLTNIGQVAGLIRSANSISVVKEGAEEIQEINEEMKGVFALGENDKHTSFENLPEEQIAKCFTKAKQLNKDALKNFANKIGETNSLGNIETQLKTFYQDSQNKIIAEITANLASADESQKEQAIKDLFSLIEKTASHDGNGQTGFDFGKLGLEEEKAEELYQAYLEVKQTAHVPSPVPSPSTQPYGASQPGDTGPEVSL